MPVEVLRHTPRETPQRKFDKLSNRFAAETWAVSTFDGFRINRAYRDIVSMGEEAIPLILGKLQRPDRRDYDSGQERSSPWLVLALDDITGQSLVERNYIKTLGYPDEMIERALEWAEAESYIEIRSPKKLARIGKELFDLLRNSILGNPICKLALRGETLEPRLRQTTREDILGRDEKEVIREFDFRGEELYLDYSGDLFIESGVSSESILLQYGNPSDEGIYRKLFVEIVKRRGKLPSASFEFGDESNTRRAQANFKDTVGWLFDPLPPRLKVA